MLILGVHVAQVSKVLDDKTPQKELHLAIMRDINKLDLNACQIFTHGPLNTIENKLNYQQIKNVCSDIDLTVHSSYATTNIWKITKETQFQSTDVMKIANVQNQIKACSLIGAWGLVIHISKMNAKRIAEVMHVLLPIAKQYNVMILLEMTASKACNTTYETPAKLDRLIELIGVDERYFGITVDTAHLWGAGVQVQEYKHMEQWLLAFKHKHKIKQFHLNGSFASKGSGKDKHEIIFSEYDKIWYNIIPQKSGVRAVVEYAKQHSIPIICEINRGLEQTTVNALNIIKTLADG